VVGEFNAWDPGADPFTEDGTATVQIPLGRHRFRYLTGDGAWFNDPQADDYEPNEHGGEDGILDLTVATTPDPHAELSVAGAAGVVAPLAPPADPAGTTVARMAAGARIRSPRAKITAR
jgi:hypothetical protein